MARALLGLSLDSHTAGGARALRLRGGLGPDAAQGDPLDAGVIDDRDHAGAGAAGLREEGHADRAARPGGERAAAAGAHGEVIAAEVDAADRQQAVAGVEEDHALRSCPAPYRCTTEGQESAADQRS